MDRPSGTVYRFGVFRYDPAQRLLFRDGEPVTLAPKALDVLQALLERRGEAVSKEDLMKAVWPDCSVEEIGLARNVSILRKALGDDADRYIETIPKRGYRFVAESEGGEEPRRPAAWILLAAALPALAFLVYWQFYRPSRYVPDAAGAASLGVVPFERAGSGVDVAFGEGLAGALATELSKVGRVQVTSPSTIRRYRRIGVPVALMTRMLGLDAVVEGTAEGFGPTVRITIRLSDVHSGKLIWAESYDATAAEAGAAETTVARAAAAQIGARLTPH